MPFKAKIINFDNLISEGGLLNINLMSSLISTSIYIKELYGSNINISVFLSPFVKIISANNNKWNYEI
tara:strand:- start:515 stop:718 length:204 start_codon:yes stop_codon:yes gene_type:complete